jgi:hypothetical protein
MYICPEATLLSVDNNGKLMQEMLLQNTEIQTAISIFDIIGGRNPDPVLWTDDISIFRNNTGSDGLNFGVAYYPFIGTSVMQTGDIDYTNFFGGDVQQLEPLLNPPEDLLAGYMRVTVRVAVTHPSEFIVFSFRKEMAKS